MVDFAIKANHEEQHPFPICDDVRFSHVNIGGELRNVMNFGINAPGKNSFIVDFGDDPSFQMWKCIENFMEGNMEASSDWADKAGKFMQPDPIITKQRDPVGAHVSNLEHAMFKSGILTEDFALVNPSKGTVHRMLTAGLNKPIFFTNTLDNLEERLEELAELREKASKDLSVYDTTTEEFSSFTGKLYLGTRGMTHDFPNSVAFEFNPYHPDNASSHIVSAVRSGDVYNLSYYRNSYVENTEFHEVPRGFMRYGWESYGNVVQSFLPFVNEADFGRFFLVSRRAFSFMIIDPPNTPIPCDAWYGPSIPDYVDIEIEGTHLRVSRDNSTVYDVRSSAVFSSRRRLVKIVADFLGLETYKWRRKRIKTDTVMWLPEHSRKVDIPRLNLGQLYERVLLVGPRIDHDSGTITGRRANDGSLVSYDRLCVYSRPRKFAALEVIECYVPIDEKGSDVQPEKSVYSATVSAANVSNPCTHAPRVRRSMDASEQAEFERLSAVIADCTQKLGEIDEYRKKQVAGDAYPTAIVESHRCLTRDIRDATDRRHALQFVTGHALSSLVKINYVALHSYYVSLSDYISASVTLGRMTNTWSINRTYARPTAYDAAVVGLEYGMQFVEELQCGIGGGS